jgi:hypothetical protein
VERDGPQLERLQAPNVHDEALRRLDDGEGRSSDFRRIPRMEKRGTWISLKRRFQQTLKQAVSVK